MAGVSQRKAEKGGQRWLQELINRHPEIINEKLRVPMGLNKVENITWLSPLEKENYIEYKDDGFIKTIGMELKERPLHTFWPDGGPNWDGLGKTSEGKIILLEAKSHSGEQLSKTHAKNSKSIDLIKRSLAATRKYFEVENNSDWTKKYYQYANRLAHLYLLRELNQIPTWLVFLYFVNDEEMNGPKSKKEWEDAIKDIHAYLGLNPERLRSHVIDLFIDVKDIGVMEPAEQLVGQV